MTNPTFFLTLCSRLVEDDSTSNYKVAEKIGSSFPIEVYSGSIRLLVLLIFKFKYLYRSILLELPYVED